MNSRQRRKLRRQYERVAAASQRLMRSWLSRPMPKVDRDEIDARRGFLAPTTCLAGLKFPASPEVGMLWFEPSTGIERRWDGHTWVCTECTPEHIL